MMLRVVFAVLAVALALAAGGAIAWAWIGARRRSRRLARTYAELEIKVIGPAPSSSVQYVPPQPLVRVERHPTRMGLPTVTLIPPAPLPHRPREDADDDLWTKPPPRSA